jgi:hypothetical protein
MHFHVTQFAHCCQFRETGTCLSRSGSGNGQFLIGCRSCSGRSVTLWRLVYDNTCHAGTTYRRGIDQCVNQNLRLSAAFFSRRLTPISFPGSLYWRAGLYALQVLNTTFIRWGGSLQRNFVSVRCNQARKIRFGLFFVYVFLTSFRIATFVPESVRYFCERKWQP